MFNSHDKLTTVISEVRSSVQLWRLRRQCRLKGPWYACPHCGEALNQSEDAIVVPLGIPGRLPGPHYSCECSRKEFRTWDLDPIDLEDVFGSES